LEILQNINETQNENQTEYPVHPYFTMIFHFISAIFLPNIISPAPPPPHPKLFLHNQKHFLTNHKNAEGKNKLHISTELEEDSVSRQLQYASLRAHSTIKRLLRGDIQQSGVLQKKGEP